MNRDADRMVASAAAAVCEALERRRLLSAAGIVITSAQPTSWDVVASTSIDGSCDFNAWQGPAQAGATDTFVVGIRDQSGQWVSGTTPYALFQGIPAANAPGNSWDMYFDGLGVPATPGSYEVVLAEEPTSDNSTAVSDFESESDLASANIGPLTAESSNPGITINSAPSLWTTLAAATINGSFDANFWNGTASPDENDAVVVGIRNASGNWAPGSEPQELSVVWPSVGSPGDEYSYSFNDLSVPTLAGQYTVVAALEPEADPVLAFEASADFASAPIGQLTTTQSPEIYGPLLPFQTWNQSGQIAYGSSVNFNDFCPIDPATGQRSLTGCVATAEAELVYYWQDISSLSFGQADAYVSNAGTSSQVSIDANSGVDDFPSFSQLTSDLANIQYDNDPTDVALVSFGLGVLSQADYGTSETDAALLNSALSAEGFPHPMWSSSWNTIEPTVIANIEAGDPVLVNFPDHIAIIDGYDQTTGQFHVVLGWGGEDDGWYTLPDENVFPDSSTTGQVIGIEYNLVPAAAKPTQLVFNTEPANGQAGTLAPVTVAIENPAGQIVKSDNDSVTLTISSGPPGATLTGVTTVQAVNGVATFTNVQINKASGTSYTLAASDTGDALSGFTSTGFKIAPAAASKLVFTTEPASTNAGAMLAPVVASIEDAYGNVETGDDSQVNLSGVASLTGTTAVNASSGVATFNYLWVNTAGTYAFTASDPTDTLPSIMSTTFFVFAAPAITSADSVTMTAGTAGLFTVTSAGSPTPALMETGNLPSGVTFTDNGNGTATLSGAPAAGAGGVFDFTIKASNGTTPDASQAFTLTVDQGPAITSAGSKTFAVGTSGIFNVTTTGFPTASLMETGNLPSGVTFTDNHNGTATITGAPAANAAGTYPFTITAGNGTLPNASQNFTLTVAPSIELAFGQQPTNATAGVAVKPAITVDVENLSGKIITTDASTVTLSVVSVATGQTVGSIFTATAKKGVATFSTVTINTAGTFTVTATDNGATMTSHSFTIAPAAAAQLVFASHQSSMAAGTGMSPAISVTVEDKFGNLVTSGPSVKLSVTSVPTGGALTGTTTVKANSSGVATFSGVSMTKAGVYTLKATTGSVSATATGGITVSVGAPATLKITKQPTTGAHGVALTTALTVTVTDQYGNLISGSQVTLLLFSGPGVLSGTLMAITNSSGIATFSDVVLTEAGTDVLLVSDGAAKTVQSGKIKVS
jgi:hypothetical protein